LYEGYVSSTLLWNLSDTEVGFFAVLAIVVAIISYSHDRSP